MQIEVQTLGGTTAALRFKRRRGMVRVVYAGSEVRSIPTESLSSHLANFQRTDEHTTQAWGDVIIAVGQGQVLLTLDRRTEELQLSDQARRELTTLAARPA